MFAATEQADRSARRTAPAEQTRLLAGHADTGRIDVTDDHPREPDPAARRAGRRGERSVVGLPILREDECLGVLNLVSDEAVARSPPSTSRSWRS